MTVVVPELIQKWGPSFWGTNLARQCGHRNGALADSAIASHWLSAFSGSMRRQLRIFGLHTAWRRWASVGGFVAFKPTVEALPFWDNKAVHTARDTPSRIEGCAAKCFFAKAQTTIHVDSVGYNLNTRI